MSTLTITLAGSAIVNGTKSYTISDSDLQTLLNWAGTALIPPGATSQQILLAWVQWWVHMTQQRVQQANVTVTTPPPITIS